MPLIECSEKPSKMLKFIMLPSEASVMGYAVVGIL